MLDFNNQLTSQIEELEENIVFINDDLKRAMHSNSNLKKHMEQLDRELVEV